LRRQEQDQVDKLRVAFGMGMAIELGLMEWMGWDLALLLATSSALSHLRLLGFAAGSVLAKALLSTETSNVVVFQMVGNCR